MAFWSTEGKGPWLGEHDLGDDPWLFKCFNRFVNIEVCSVDILVARVRIGTAFIGDVLRELHLWEHFGRSRTDTISTYQALLWWLGRGVEGGRFANRYFRNGYFEFQCEEGRTIFRGLAGRLFLSEGSSLFPPFLCLYGGVPGTLHGFSKQSTRLQSTRLRASERGCFEGAGLWIKHAEVCSHTRRRSPRSPSLCLRHAALRLVIFTLLLRAVTRTTTVTAVLRYVPTVSVWAVRDGQLCFLIHGWCQCSGSLTAKRVCCDLRREKCQCIE